MAAKTKVIIVDDSQTIRDMFTAILSADPGIEVVATAEDPFDAREKIKRLNPDIITLDVEMPKMDGISFLEKIMTLRPMPVIMASTLTTRGAETTLHALEVGAVDYIAKPTNFADSSLEQFKQELTRKVKSGATIRMTGPKPKYTGTQILLFNSANTHQLIALGSSTGGVEALRDILIHIPANAPPIVITQHMPEIFTASFARRIDSICAMKVQEAAHGQPVLPGNVYIAAGDHHLEIVQKGSQLTCQLSKAPLVSGHRPSVDVLFESVAKIKNKKLVGAILTGMGHDGAAGLLSMRNAGASTLGQSEASCTVYGMPKAAYAVGGVEKEISLTEMPKEILKLCNL